MGEDMKNRSGPPRLPVNLWTNEIVTLRISVQRGAVGGGAAPGGSDPEAAGTEVRRASEPWTQSCDK